MINMKNKTTTLSEIINEAIKDLPIDEAVVEKWKIIREFVLKNNIENMKYEISDAMLSDTCAYCKEFNDCNGCPIKETTKQDKCHGTPWEACHTALYLVPEENKSILIQHINREIKFLQSLGVATENKYPECQESYQIKIYEPSKWKNKVINTTPKDNQVYINQHFASNSTFGDGCYFIRCKFENNITFGDDCVFSEDTFFGSGCVFGSNAIFGGWCVFKNNNVFDVGATFGENTLFGNNNSFEVFTRFGRYSGFGKNCFVKEWDNKKKEYKTIKLITGTDIINKEGKA